VPKGGDGLGDTGYAVGVWAHETTATAFTAINRGPNQDAMCLCHGLSIAQIASVRIYHFVLYAR